MNIQIEAAMRNGLLNFFRTEQLQGELGTKLIDLLLTYYNNQRKRISAHPRRVHEPRQASWSSDGQRALEEIRRRFSVGKDLSAYLSGRITRARYQDAMLNDWGIHHLHLGEQKADGSVIRTKEVLFVRVEPEDAFFIGMFNHQRKENPHVWVNTDALNTIETNWSNLFDEYVLPGTLDVTPVPPETRLIFRGRKGQNGALVVPIKLKTGRVIAPPGWGMVLSGEAIKDVNEADELMKRLALMNTTPEDVFLLREVLHAHGVKAAVSDPPLTIQITGF